MLSKTVDDGPLDLQHCDVGGQLDLKHCKVGGQLDL